MSTNGHLVTNAHVVQGCVGDIQGNLTGEKTGALRDFLDKSIVPYQISDAKTELKRHTSRATRRRWYSRQAARRPSAV